MAFCLHVICFRFLTVDTWKASGLDYVYTTHLLATQLCHYSPTAKRHAAQCSHCLAAGASSPTDKNFPADWAAVALSAEELSCQRSAGHTTAFCLQNFFVVQRCKKRTHTHPEQQKFCRSVSSVDKAWVYCCSSEETFTLPPLHLRQGKSWPIAFLEDFAPTCCQMAVTATSPSCMAHDWGASQSETMRAEQGKAIPQTTI